MVYPLSRLSCPRAQPFTPAKSCVGGGRGGVRREPPTVRNSACMRPTTRPVKVHLAGGTHELFRHYYAVPSHINRDGQEVAAVPGVLGSMLALLEGGATL